MIDSFVVDCEDEEEGMGVQKNKNADVYGGGDEADVSDLDQLAAPVKNIEVNRG